MHKEMKYPKNRVLTALKENKEKHVRAFETAMEKYWVAVRKALKELCAKAEKETLSEKDILGWRLPRPKNYAPEYEVAIKMLEMASDDDVTLTEVEFRQYIMDEWEWKHQWDTVVSTYA